MPCHAYTRQEPVHYKCGSPQEGWLWPTVHVGAVWEFFGTELWSGDARRRGSRRSSRVCGCLCPGGYIGRFEQPIRQPQWHVAQRIDEMPQTDVIFERMRRKLIKGPTYAEYFAHAAELERLATEIPEYAPAV